jgi:hypothetical protein
MSQANPIVRFFSFELEQNIVFRKPFLGSAVITLFFLAILLIYRPLGVHSGDGLSYEWTMFLYSLIAGFTVLISVSVLKLTPLFDPGKPWTIARESLVVFVCLFDMGFSIWLAAFFIEPPADRGNWATFLNSMSYAFLLGIIPFLVLGVLRGRAGKGGGVVTEPENAARGATDGQRNIRPDDFAVDMSGESGITRPGKTFLAPSGSTSQRPGNYVGVLPHELGISHPENPNGFTSQESVIAPSGNSARTAGFESGVIQRGNPTRGATHKSVLLRSRSVQETLEVNPDTLLFAVSEGNYTVFHSSAESGKPEQHSFRITMAEAQEQLESLSFILRTHRAFLLNVHKIAEVSGNRAGFRVRVEGHPQEIPVSRSYVDDFIEALREHRPEIRTYR